MGAQLSGVFAREIRQAHQVQKFYLPAMVGRPRDGFCPRGDFWTLAGFWCPRRELPRAAKACTGFHVNRSAKNIDLGAYTKEINGRAPEGEFLDFGVRLLSVSRAAERC